MTPSPIREAIFALLKQHGPMHYQQIADALEDKYSVQQIRGSIRNARHLYPGQIFRVTRWITKDQDKAYPISHLTAVFAAGKGRDAPKPVLDEEQLRLRRQKTHARFRDKNRAIIRAKKRSKSAKNKARTEINPWAALLTSTAPTAGASRC